MLEVKDLVIRFHDRIGGEAVNASVSSVNPEPERP